MNLYKIILSILFLISGLFAQETLTLEQALQTALSKNHDIAMAKNSAQIIQNTVNIGSAGMLPSINASVSSNYQDSETGMAGASETTTNSAQLSASYTLFDGFGNVYRFKKLTAAGKAGQLDAQNLVENTLLQVSSTFYNAAIMYEHYNVAKELLDISKQRLQRAEKQKEYGQANSIQILAAKVDFNADSVSLAQTQFAWDNSRRSLNVLLNKDINEKYQMDSAIQFNNEFDIDVLVEKALQQNPAFLAAEYRSQQAKYDVIIARTNYLPQIALTGSYGLSQTNDQIDFGFDDPAQTIRVGASASLNLFNGFQRSIQSQNAKLSYKNQQLSLDKQKLLLKNNVISSFESFKNSLLIYELEAENVDAAELNFKRTQDLFKLGHVTTTQFRESQLNLIRAKNSMTDAKYNAKLDELNLLQLTGQLVTEQQQ